MPLPKYRVRVNIVASPPEFKKPRIQESELIHSCPVGHSQGGVLAKLTACRTGEALLRAVTGMSIHELNLSPEEERLVRKLAVFDPLPQVRRVIFISTPHRGSYQAGDIARKLARASSSCRRTR